MRFKNPITEHMKKYVYSHYNKPDKREQVLRKLNSHAVLVLFECLCSTSSTLALKTALTLLQGRTVKIHSRNPAIKEVLDKITQADYDEALKEPDE